MNKCTLIVARHDKSWLSQPVLDPCVVTDMDRRQYKYEEDAGGGRRSVAGIDKK